MTNWSQEDVDRINAERTARRMPVKLAGVALGASYGESNGSGKGKVAQIVPSASKRHKYRAEPCIVTADLTLFSKEDILTADFQVRPLGASKMRESLKVQAARCGIVGDWFGSLKEGRRWIELKRLEKVGGIRNLQRQIEFVLCTWHSDHAQCPRVGVYRADFVYEELVPKLAVWIPRVEDCKGMKTALYRWKKKHVEAQYGIQIHEL